MLPESLGKKITDKNIPFCASFELTYRCNQKCVHCYQTYSHDKAEELSTGEVRGILRQLTEAGCLFLALTGGEPLLREDFWDIAGFAGKNNFVLTVQTNGTLIDARAAKQLKELNFNQVHISLLGGRAQTHDAITGLPGSFEKAVVAARLLKEEGLTVFFKGTLLKENAGELEEMDELAESLDVFTVFSPMVYPCLDCSASPLEHRLDDKSLKKVFSFLARKRKEDVLLPYKPEPESPLCLAAKTDCGITPQGMLYPCIGLPVLLGDLKKEPFRQIWLESENARMIRQLKIKDWQECRDCALADICVRCPGLGYLEEGSLTTPSKENCRMAKILKEVLDERQEKKIRKTEVER